MATHKKSNDWRIGSKRRMIAEIAERGLSKREAFSELRALVESQIRPMVFQANVGGRREPKPMAEQLIELKNEIGRVYAELGRATSSDFDSEEISEDSTDDTGTDSDSEEISDDEETTPDETKVPRKSRMAKIEDSLKEFLKRAREIRAFCEERKRLSESVDWVSMRPFQAAAKLIPAGVPVDALLDAMTIHWAEDTRRDAGIQKFDFVSFSRQVMSERGITDIDGETPHKLFGYVLILAENRIPIFLSGPAGTGKSHLARQLAAYFGAQYGSFKYGETPMSPGATRGDLLGRHTAGGFISAEFAELYGSGGVFNFEEIDAADPGMLIVLNNALASQTLYNSASGESIKRHANFVAVSTANTWGTGGANREYTAREKLDAATIDRWRMGRVFVDLDETVEESILFSGLAK